MIETVLLDGKTLSTKKLATLGQLIQEKQLHPQLAIMQVGDNPASNQYIALKTKRGTEIGIQVDTHKVSTITDLQEELTKVLRQSYNGIIIQLPLPEGAKTQGLLDLVPVSKDVDGLSTESLSNLKTGTAQFKPAVVEAVLGLIQGYGLSLGGKTIAVLGKGPYVGQSIIDTLRSQNLKTDIIEIDEFTPNPKEQLQMADIVISCIGKPHIYSAKDLKEGSILIDVGTSPDPATGKIVGDFDTTEAQGYLQAYTPVPGGVGPMTVASLLENVTKAAQSVI